MFFYNTMLYQVFLLSNMFYHVFGLYSVHDGCTGQGRRGSLHQEHVYVLV